MVLTNVTTFGVAVGATVLVVEVEVEDGHLKKKITLAYRGDTQLSESLLIVSQLND